MNSRERVLRALSHKSVDRIPVDLCGHNDSAVHRIAYEQLAAHLGLRRHRPAVANSVENVVYADEEILRLFQVDTRAVYLPIPDDEGEYQPDGSYLLTWPDGSIWRKPSGGYYYDLDKPPLDGDLTSKAIADMPWPTFSQAELDALGRRAKKARLESGFAVVMSGFLIMPASGPQIWRGFEQWCMDTLCDTKRWQEMTEAYMQRALAQAEGILNAVGEFIDVAYFIGDDIATQRAPYISPAFYRKYLKPFHQRAMDFIRARTDAKVIFHMCGAAKEFIPDLIDIGVDAINPVQTSAAGMDPVDLKNEFGRDIAFWGGVDTQRVLPLGTPEDVKEEVRRIIRSLGPSGLVLAGCHNIQADVPPENIVAMLRAAYAFGLV